MMRASSWCATACCTAKPSPPPRLTCAAKNGDWRAARPGQCDFGPDLSRGFRALKTWFTLKVYGTDALGAAISRTCALARYLESRIQETPELELLAPVTLNIVCFRYRAGDDAHRVNARIVADLHEAGDVAPSTTVIDGRLAIRAAIVNHRTSRAEIDTLIEKVVAAGRAIEDSALRSRQAPAGGSRGLDAAEAAGIPAAGTGGANCIRSRRDPVAV